MRPSTFVLVIGLLASPAALLANPHSRDMTDGLWDIAQNTIPNTSTAPDQTINGRPLLDAPVPSEPPAGVAPVDRVAGPGSRDLASGPVNSTPFSAAPTSALQAGAPGSPNGAAGGDITPSLGR